jgi:hypothetical protein
LGVAVLAVEKDGVQKPVHSVHAVLLLLLLLLLLPLAACLVV